MTAFDTSSNNANVSFTNAYATAVLEAAAVEQFVNGFARTTGKRYFEFYIDDGGGPWRTCTKPYVGITGYGASSNLLGPLDVNGATISTGDVFMFSVDFGGGTDHAGNVKYTTITGAGGNLMSPVFVDIGKNGTWNTDLWGFVNWKYPAFGRTGWQMPMLYRTGDSTSGISSSAVTISLRVETTSFAYAIPSGFVAWGDGPEGGGASTLTDAGIYWDPARKSSKMSLSGGNLYAVFKHSYTFTSTLNMDFIYTSQLPSTGKRLIETINRNSSATNLVGSSGIGLADETVSITAPATVSTAKIGTNVNAVQYYQRGASHLTSITCGTEGNDFYGDAPGLMLFVDFDAGRYWQTGGLITSAIVQEAFRGEKSALVCDPYLGNDGHTFTNSIGMRMYVEHWKNTTVSAASIYLNVGQTAFETFPQLPGWISMDGGRRVYGVGAKWDSAKTYAGSTTFYASDLCVRTTNPNVMQGTTKKSGGKYYFEIFRQCPAAAYDFVGVRFDGETSMSATNTASWEASGLWFSSFNKRKNRYGTATSWTNSASSLGSGNVQERFGIAIDFDLGHIWCGIWNKNDRAMNWVSGANPVTDTQPDMTFTACTTFVIGAVTRGGTPVGGNVLVLVGEDTNVIGKPAGFTTWNGTTSVTASATMTPSAAGAGGGGRVLWPYGVQT